MKILFTWTIVILLCSSLNAQDNNIQNLLNDYLQIKNALVDSNGKKAREYAQNMQAALKNTPNISGQKSMLKTVGEISKTTDIEKQRKAFADLSEPMWNLVKNTEDLTQDVYYQYCPMKKAYWISAEEAIRNPYYGSQMLTCGSVKETKKK